MPRRNSDKALLTRRGFLRRMVISGIGLAAGISVTGKASAVGMSAVPIPSWRYAHAELGAGPWNRASLVEAVSRVAQRLDIRAIGAVSCLGDRIQGAALPPRFLVTVDVDKVRRLTMIAGGSTADAGEVTVRSEMGERRVYVVADGDAEALGAVPSDALRVGGQVADAVFHTLG